jgi:hypothetical protein
MSTLEAIIDDLKALPPPKLAAAAAFVRKLHAPAPQAPAALERAAAVLTATEGTELANAIKEGCEKVDGRDW